MKYVEAVSCGVKHAKWSSRMGGMTVRRGRLRVPFFQDFLCRFSGKFSGGLNRWASVSMSRNRALRRKIVLLFQ